MKLRLLSSLLAVLLPIAADASGTGGTTTIQAFAIDTSFQMVNLIGSVTWSNPDSCGSSSLVVIQMSTTNYKDQLAAIMLASASGKSVSLWVNGCVASPWGNVPLVESVTVLN
jgi:hypothetical protein